MLLGTLGMSLVGQSTLHWQVVGVVALAVAAAWSAWLGWTAWRRQHPRSLPPRAPLVQADQAATGDAETTIVGHASHVDAVPALAAVRVVFASQTGFAEQLARQTEQMLHGAGVTARLDSLGALNVDELRATGCVLFVVSTTGDGEPPDDAAMFLQTYMARPAELSSLRYGVLALGDSDYDDFCGFGHKLVRWLQASGAQPLFDLVEVDSEDESALRHWQHCLALVTGSRDLPDWQTPRYQRWRLLARRLMNPGSVGEPCFDVALQSLQGNVRWQAGDLVEIGPCQAPHAVSTWLAAYGLDGTTLVTAARERLTLAALLARSRLPSADEVAGLDAAGVAAMVQRLPHREYSIASLPGDGALHLLVRQMHGPDGGPGLGSHWLAEQAEVGAEIALRVRSNINFHLPAAACPLILIGNGTGMAALRALLEARIATRQSRNWLLFGERSATHDFYYREQIEQWLASGELERADFAWSRDQPKRIYVQQRLREAADEVRRWVDAGAAIYVCGSLAGMAPAVDAVLREVLGTPQVEQLRAEGRYRRDVY